MNNTVTCKNCGKEGNFNEIKLYNVPGKTDKAQFLCQECYNKLKKNQNTTKCPECKKPIFYNATWCPYCGNNFLKNKEKLKKCKICGTEIKEKTNYCPFCGEFTNDQIIEETDIQRNVFVKPTKILSIIIIAIFLVSIFFGFHAFTDTANPSQNILDTYNPNAQFNLKSSEFMDYQGELALNINYETNDNVEIRVLDDGYRLVGSTNTKKEEKTKLIKTSILQKDVKGSFYKIVAKSGPTIIFEETTYFIGVFLKINPAICEWQTIYSYDFLKNFSLTITNTGDMPAYIEYLEITIDTLHGPYQCELKETNKIILPEQTQTICFNTENIPKITRIERHALQIKIIGNNNQCLPQDKLFFN